MGDPDAAVDLQARRLVASAGLTAHALRTIGARVPPNYTATELVRAAQRLAVGGAALLERAQGLRAEPPYPGVTTGPQSVAGGLRLVLGAGVTTDDGAPLGIAFTTLIPGRPPLVSIAPPGAVLPAEWKPLPAQLRPGRRPLRS